MQLLVVRDEGAILHIENDVLMFKRSGLSIAMGNASPEVQKQANFVTTSSEEEGFANGVERFVLPRPALLQNESKKARKD